MGRSPTTGSARDISCRKTGKGVPRDGAALGSSPGRWSIGLRESPCSAAPLASSWGVPGPSSSCPPLLGCPSISPTRSFLSPPRVAGPAPRRSCPLTVAGQLGSSTTPASGQPGERPCNGLRSSSTLWDAPTPPVGLEPGISEDWKGRTCVGAPQPLSELWGRRGGGRGLYANPSPWGPSTFCGRVQDRDERRKFSLLLENSASTAPKHSNVHAPSGPQESMSGGAQD